MKRLTITYSTVDGTVTLFDGAVTELTWTDSASGVRVEGKTRASGGNGILDALTALSSKRDLERVNDKEHP